MHRTRYFLLLMLCSAPFAALTVAAVWLPMGIFVNLGAGLLAPLVLTAIVLWRLPCRTSRRGLAGFVVEFLYAWGVLLVTAAGFGLLLDLFALPILGRGTGSVWGGMVWASSHGGGQMPGVLILPGVYAVYGWVVALLAAFVSPIVRAVRQTLDERAGEARAMGTASEGDETS